MLLRQTKSIPLLTHDYRSLPKVMPLFLAIFVFFAVLTPISAFSAKTLSEKIIQAKIFPAGTPVSVDDIGDGEALVVTERNAKAVDRDCVIDAILVSTKMMDSNKEIKRVRAQFFNGNGDLMSQVLIRAGDVRAYAAKAMTEKELLGSIDVKHSGNPSKLSTLVLKTNPGNEIAALGALVYAMKTFAGLEKTGFDASVIQPPVDNIFALLDKRQCAQARRETKLLVHRATSLKSILTNTEKKSPVSHNAKDAQKQAEIALRSVAGLEAPIRGLLTGRRAVLLGKIREEENQDHDVKEAHKMYLDLQELATGGSTKDVNAAIDKIVDKLTAQQKTERADGHSTARPALN